MKSKVFVVMMGCAMVLSCREAEKVEVVEEEDLPAVAAVEPKKFEPLTDEELREFKRQSLGHEYKTINLRSWRSRVREKQEGIEWAQEVIARLPELDATQAEDEEKLKRVEQEWEDHLDRTNVMYAEEPPPYPAKRARELIAGFDDELAVLKTENAELREKLKKKEQP